MIKTAAEDIGKTGNILLFVGRVVGHVQLNKEGGEGGRGGGIKEQRTNR